MNHSFSSLLQMSRHQNLEFLCLIPIFTFIFSRRIIEIAFMMILSLIQNRINLRTAWKNLRWSRWCFTQFMQSMSLFLEKKRHVYLYWFSFFKLDLWLGILTLWLIELKFNYKILINTYSVYQIAILADLRGYQPSFCFA